MRWSAHSRSHAHLLKAGTAAIVALAAAGCSSDVGRFDAPLFAGSTSNQRQIMSSYGSPPTATGDVQRASLPPVGPAYASTAAGQGRWTSAGAPTVTVEAGETADSISRRYGVPVDVIVSANRLSSPWDIRPGMRLAIPTYTYDDTAVASATSYAADAAKYGNGYGNGPASAMPQDASQEVATPSGSYGQTLNSQADGLGGPGGRAGRVVAAGTHTVAPGDTAYNIAYRYGISVQDLIVANNLPADGSVRLGQTLQVPAAGSGGNVVATSAPAQPAAAERRSAPPAVAAALSKPEPRQVASLPEPQTMTDASASAPPVAAAPAPSAAAAEGFRWPVRGRIIAGFGKQPDGARNDGINLAVPAGTPIKAAEQGTVIYAGNELQGYGNLVLVQHKDGWVSAYAHADEITVKRGDGVQRGQVLGKAGATGSVSQPQLHFELRKGSKPVDPLPHLADG